MKSNEPERVNLNVGIPRDVINWMDEQAHRAHASRSTIARQILCGAKEGKKYA